jgi:hypothetical protein
MRRAVKDLTASYPDRFRLPEKFDEKLADYQNRLPRISQALDSANPEQIRDACRAGKELLDFQRSVLLANPLLDFDKILVLRRAFPGDKARHMNGGGELGFVTLNAFTEADIPREKRDNEIGVLSNLRDQPRFDRVHKPEIGRIIRDLQLDFDVPRVAFASRGQKERWSVNEWTLSSYRSYPYVEEDGRNDGKLEERKVARGGSWKDRPADAGSSVRRAYESWQKVYDVGFRVILMD